MKTLQYWDWSLGVLWFKKRNNVRVGQRLKTLKIKVEDFIHNMHEFRDIEVQRLKIGLFSSQIQFISLKKWRQLHLTRGSGTK